VVQLVDWVCFPGQVMQKTLKTTLAEFHHSCLALCSVLMGAWKQFTQGAAIHSPSMQHSHWK